MRNALSKINYIIPTYKGFYKELHIIVSYVFPYFLSMLLTVCWILTGMHVNAN